MGAQVAMVGKFVPSRGQRRPARRRAGRCPDRAQHRCRMDRSRIAARRSTKIPTFVLSLPVPTAKATQHRCVPRPLEKVRVFVCVAVRPSLRPGLWATLAGLQSPRHKNPHHVFVAPHLLPCELETCRRPCESSAPTSKLSKASKLFRWHFLQANQQLAQNKVRVFGRKVGIFVCKVGIFVGARWGNL